MKELVPLALIALKIIFEIMQNRQKSKPVRRKERVNVFQKQLAAAVGTGDDALASRLDMDIMFANEVYLRQ